MDKFRDCDHDKQRRLSGWIAVQPPIEGEGCMKAWRLIYERKSRVNTRFRAPPGVKWLWASSVASGSSRQRAGRACSSGTEKPEVVGLYTVHSYLLHFDAWWRDLVLILIEKITILFFHFPLSLISLFDENLWMKIEMKILINTFIERIIKW